MADRHDEVRIRVRYPEVDRMGVAHHASHFTWFEVGRTEFMRQRGVPYARVEEGGIFLPVIEATCSYVSPARYDDVIRVLTTVSEVRGARVTFSYQIESENKGGLLAKGNTTHAVVGRDGHPRRLPAFLRELAD